MNKRFCAGAMLLALTLLMGGCAVMSAPAQEDGAGADESLSIVSTSAAICEILDLLDYDNVVGVPETEKELPARYDGAQSIGAPMSPDLEIVKSIDPDLVLSPASLEGSLSTEYNAVGIDCAFLDLSSVEGMYSAIASLGALLGRESQAAALVTDYEDYLAAYQGAGGEAPSILLLMAFPDGFYLVATEKSYVGNLVELAGGENVYANYAGDENGFVNINAEDMIQRDPDIILVFAHYSEDAAFAFMDAEFADNETWQYYDAVQEGRVYYLPSASFGMSASLSSWKEGLAYLQPLFYGE